MEKSHWRVFTLFFVWNLLSLSRGYSATFSTTNTEPIVVGDNSEFFVPIIVYGLPSILSEVSVVRVELSAEVGYDINSKITLRAPSSKEVVLYKGQINQTNFEDIEFSDQGSYYSSGVNNFIVGAGLSFIPAQRLNNFNGENPNNVWSLVIRAEYVPFSLNYAKLYISDYCTDNPCLNGGSCDSFSQKCVCPPGYHGRLCQKVTDIIGDYFVVGNQPHEVIPDCCGKVYEHTIEVPYFIYGSNDVDVSFYLTVPISSLSEISVKLENPLNEEIVLFSQWISNTAHNLINSQFNDNGPMTIASDALNSYVPAKGPYHPKSGSLGHLGDKSYGDWKVKIEDYEKDWTGTFFGWKLTLHGPKGCPSEVNANAYYSYTFLGTSTIGHCLPTHFGSTLRECKEVEGIPEWQEPFSGSCTACPENSLAPPGSDSIEDCHCAPGYISNELGNCVRMFCLNETFNEVYYPQTFVGEFVIESCPYGLVGDIRRICTQLNDNPYWLPPISTCHVPSCKPSHGFPETLVDVTVELECPAGYYGEIQRTCYGEDEWGTFTECIPCPYPKTSYPGSLTIDDCYEENECENNPNLCQPSGLCVNVNPGWECHCLPTSDYPQTKEGNFAKSAKCSAGYYGYYYTHCELGGVFSSENSNCSPCPFGSTSPPGTETIEGCSLDDACAINNGGCDENAICVVGEDNDHFCMCPDESDFAAAKEGTTVHINHCPQGKYGVFSRTCELGGVWSDVSGECIDCPSGFTSPPFSPTIDYCNLDIDECLMPNSCVDHTYCTNLEGSYECNCLSGYTGDGKVNCIPSARTSFLEQFNPIARCLFDGNMYDSTGNGHICSSQSNMVPFYQRDNPSNKALRLFGNSFVNIPSIYLDGSFTIEFLFNPQSFNYFDFIFLLPNSTSSRNECLLGVAGSEFRQIQWYQENLVPIAKSIKILRLGVTHSLVISVRNGKIITFVDNIQLGTFDMEIPAGHYALQFGLTLNGYIDEVGVYDMPIFTPPGNSLNDPTECINACPQNKICVNNPFGFACQNA